MNCGARTFAAKSRCCPRTGAKTTDSETVFTLDNYRAPLFLDGRLYLFYEGLTSLDSRTGKERRRESSR
jgi:hypothetical protein